jgi:long-chain acyl-CoA synthetase
MLYPAIHHIIGFEMFSAAAPGELTLNAIVEQGAREQANLDIAAIARTVMPQALATLIYTSGTTGEPKGVMLSHDNLASNALDTSTVLPLDERDRHMSFLPLCHAFERTAGYYLMVAIGAEIWFVPRIDDVVARLAEVQPTIFISVPRLYEKVRDAVSDKIGRAAGLAGVLGRWALRQARLSGARRLAGQRDRSYAHWIADRLVLRKIRARFGGRMRIMCSGGAALPQDVWRFFFDIGMLILEGYGLTETSPVVSINQPERLRPGTVGPLIPRVQARIAEDGEVLIKGPCVMQGYYNQPAATRAVIDDQGWLATGDLGRYEDGFLAITGRKKELLVLNNGKNVAPVPLEARFRAIPLVAECVVCGEGYNYLTALIVPDFPQLETWAAAQGLSCEPRSALLEHPLVLARYRQAIDDLSGDLAPYEQIKKFALLADELTQAAGLLTPTLKVRRGKVYEQYQAMIEKLYAS